MKPANLWRGPAAAMFAVGWGSNQFTSLLIAYRDDRGLTTATVDALFGSYALALMVALLIGGPAADRFGRRAILRPAIVISFVASCLLIAGTHSVPLLYAGRFLAGLASGAAFAAGTAWVKELSSAPGTPEDAGARRAALSLSAGFGFGPLAAAAVAQWLPEPLVLAYLPHLVITLLALPGAWNAPETVPLREGPGLLARMRIRGIAQPRFLGVVVPAAIWVFAAPSIAFAVLPALVSQHLGGYPTIFSGVAAALTLGTGVAVQPVARRLDQPGRVSGVLLGLGCVVLGTILGAWAAQSGRPVLAMLACVPLGAGYGLLLVSGLLETQRLALPGHLAGLTAFYYVLTYLGFGLPLLLAWLHAWAAYPAMLLVVAAVAVGCTSIIAAAARRTRSDIVGDPAVRDLSR